MRIFLLSLIPLTASLTGCGKPATSTPSLNLSFDVTQCQMNLPTAAPFQAASYVEHLTDVWSTGEVRSTCQVYGPVTRPNGTPGIGILGAGESLVAGDCELTGPTYTLSFSGNVVTVHASGQPYDGNTYSFAASDCNEQVER
jgi:hypothetical protein